MKLRPEQLAAHLSKGLAPVYVVYGDEPLLIQEAVDAIRAVARIHGYSERHCLMVDSRFDWNALLRTSNSLSLFAARRLLELRLGTVKPDDTGGKVLSTYAKSPAGDAVLLIIGGKFDAAAQRSQWLAALDQIGVVVRAWPIDARQLPGWIEQRMQACGLHPTAEAIALLAERVEGNLLAAGQEIAKLYLLFGSGTLSAEQLLEVVSDSARYSVYDLVDSALQGHAGRIVRILNHLRAEGIEAVLVSWALHREIRLLTGLVFAMEQGVSLETALTRSQVWEKRKPLLRHALQRLSKSRCRRLLGDCARLDRVIKGVEKGNVWDAILNLSLCLAGQHAWPVPVIID